ncbi:MAG: FAD-dependent oxidoreductase [Thermodesulfobacteriota bacterium]
MAVKEYTDADVLVIGGGIAGLRAAIEASQQGVEVVMANKGHVGQDGAAVWMAGGGYQAAIYEPDSIQQHIRDTIKAGYYLNRQDLVETFLRLAPASVEDLARWRVRWKKEDGKYSQIRIMGETHPRSMMHTKDGEHLGGEYRKALPRQARLKKNIRFLEDTPVIDLLKNGDRVVGAAGLNMKNGTFQVVRAKSTILATGGFMACYKFNTANPTLTGDGHGMAYRAGAKMCDMEFVQFFPAATLWPPNLYRDVYPYGLFFEIYGHLYNRLGERFMERYYPVEKEFVPREAQSRAICKEVREGRGSPHGGAYISLKHLPRNLLNDFLQKTEHVPFFKSLKKAGVDLRQDAIEIGPGAHYVQGGCSVSVKCETTLPGLYAAGECAGGKDGADRLAGNALPFCMAMGYVAGKEAAARAKTMNVPDLDGSQVDELCHETLAPLERKEGANVIELKKKIQNLMSTCNMYQRNEKDLEIALKELETIRKEEAPVVCVSTKNRRFNIEWLHAIEFRNMLDVAEMSMGCAIRRKETRGLHERADYPAEDPEWLRNNVVTRVGQAMQFATEPVDFPYMSPPSTR